ncbi:MAG TPA: CYTH domain-containing protein [Clostridia bacterium]|nr:CYTH domain-containing protein [Clostridia bacterium]
MKNVETEIKFSIPDTRLVQEIISDRALLQMTLLKSWNSMPITAIYYDTPALDLLNAGIVYRVRKEGDRFTATVKKGGNPESFLQQRQEWNFKVSSFLPDINPFLHTGVGGQMKDVIGGREMQELFSCRFHRTFGLLLLENHTRAELAVDVGEIVAGSETEPIREIELELKQGELSIMLETGSFISERYGLVPETRSKFSRGIALLGIK